MLSSTGERLSEADLTGHDVLVIGGGNAALCAALSAREQGASVLLLESAPRQWRGGNSIHTRNLRCMHCEPTDVLSDAYLEDEFFDDVWRVTGGITNEALAKHVIRASETCTDWMKSYGVRFQPSLGGTLHLGRTNAFFLGGGKALVNTYYQAAERLGVTILYEAEAEQLVFDGNRFDHALVTYNGSPRKVSAKSVVIASGGFESNQAWLEEAWGEVSRNFLIRGTRFNQGKMLRSLIDNHAMVVGDPMQGHAVAIDARAPKYDGGIVTRVDCVSLGIVVNRDGLRFYDEGEDFWPKRYAIWGRLIAKQPGQVGYSITDAKAQGALYAVSVSTRAGRYARGVGAQARPAGGCRTQNGRGVQCGRAAWQLRSQRARRLPYARGDTRKDPLGAAYRRASFLRLSTAYWHYLHVLRRQSR